jgi:hypothetical protein
MKRLILAAALWLCASPALAQAITNIGVADSAPYTKSQPLTVGVAASPVFGQPPFAVPVRALAINVTVAGNVTIELQDGSTMILTLPVGYYVLPYQVIEITAATATATYTALG